MQATKPPSPPMFASDLIRQCLLGATALVFFILAIRTWLVPAKVAEELGYQLTGANGHSELFAIYVGLWLASGAMAAVAAVHIQQPLLGDWVALLVLGQPLGRLLAIPRFGLPSGPLLGFFALEIIGGLALLAVRPTG